MSNLHRLRRYSYRGEGDDSLTELVGDIHWAADEIERLTAENKLLWAVYDAAMKLKFSGTHLYDCDLKLGKAIAKLKEKDHV